MEKLETLSIPTELLGLNDIEIIESRLNSAGEVIINVNSLKKDIPCHQCGELCAAHGKGTALKLRHLPILGRKTYIELTPPRGICKKCDRTTTQALSWHKRNGRYTKAYEENILLSMVGSTLVDVGIKEGVSETGIQNIIDRHIESKVNWRTIKKLGLLGIDEIALKKGYQDYITLISSRIDGKHKILAVLQGREKATIKTFYDSIPNKQRKTIVAICCDMCDAYINAARDSLGDQVVIIVDRFHVAKLYRKSLISLRKTELTRLRKELSDEDYKSLKQAIFILVKKQECYSKKEKIEVDKLFFYSPALKAAYKLTRQLTAIFNTRQRKETANKKFNEWIKKVKHSDVCCFSSFIETMKKYQDSISNYFINRDTSGFVEGLNNKFKVIKRRCYGITNLKHFFQRIFLDIEGYDFLINNYGVIA